MDVNNQTLSRTATGAFNIQAAEYYDPALGWNTTAQPTKTANVCTTIEAYRALAAHVLAPMQVAVHDFFDRNELKFMEVSQEEFHNEFEKAPIVNGRRISFNDWVKAKRLERGIRLKPDVLYVSPCIKGEERSEGKVENQPSDQIHRTKDYARDMIIVLGDSRNKRAHKLSVDLLGEIKSGILLDPSFGVIGRNDQFARPHDKLPNKTHYRGEHILAERQAVDEIGRPLKDLSLVCETKIEHGFSQDTYRLTREIQDFFRATESSMYDYTNRCGIDAAHNIGRHYELANRLVTLGSHLHDQIHAIGGFNRFITPPKDPQNFVDYTPLPVATINEEIRQIIHLGGMSTRNMLASSGINMSGIEFPAYQPMGIA